MTAVRLRQKGGILFQFIFSPLKFIDIFIIPRFFRNVNIIENFYSKNRWNDLSDIPTAQVTFSIYPALRSIQMFSDNFLLHGRQDLPRKYRCKGNPRYGTPRRIFPPDRSHI